MSQSSIEWTEMTWNPTTGCSKLSAGCKFCYAEIMTRRLQAMGIDKYAQGFRNVMTHEEELGRPFLWKKPRTVFVNSMSDLFHKDIPLEFIQRVFDTMNQCRQHTFQILTKRGDVLEAQSPYLTWSDNIWMGVSVEDDNVSLLTFQAMNIKLQTRVFAEGSVILGINSCRGEIKGNPLELTRQDRLSDRLMTLLRKSLETKKKQQ